MKGRNIEKKIYECLGVNIFRKCLLVIDKLAKLLHLDIEYKINNKTIEGLEEFKSKKKLLGTTHIMGTFF